jgi:hypothetical protein
VIAHETAHALLDGMHRRFTEASNPDVLALHEAFADIVALFQHFSIPEVLKHVISKTRGDLAKDNQLAKLAHEFGRAIGRIDALRSAIGRRPDPTLLQKTMEPHRRGSILMAAVFDAFLAIYRRRTEDLVRLATQGTGVLPEGAIHPDLVNRLARAAAKSSQHVLNMCIRALDYLPPVDVTFGDYLRALITADYDLVPDDGLSYRTAFIEAFRGRGIYPREVRSLAEESLRWEGPESIPGYREAPIDLGCNLKDRMREWNLKGNRERIYWRMKPARQDVHEAIKSWDEKRKGIVGLDPRLSFFEVHAIRPMRRTGPQGQLRMDAAVEVTQRIPGYFDMPRKACPDKPIGGAEPDFWFRGGSTMIIDLDEGSLRYCIYKRIQSDSRYERQKAFLLGDDASPSLQATYFDAKHHLEREEVFSFLHRSWEEVIG